MVSRNKFWIFVVLAFFIGAVFSGVIVYQYLFPRFSDSVALSSIYSDIAYAKRDVQLLMLDDASLRCQMSKIVDNEIGFINGYNIAVDPVADVDGVLAEMVKSRSKLIDLYKTSSVSEHARGCSE